MHAYAASATECCAFLQLRVKYQTLYYVLLTTLFYRSKFPFVELLQLSSKIIRKICNSSLQTY